MLDVIVVYKATCSRCQKTELVESETTAKAVSILEVMGWRYSDDQLDLYCNQCKGEVD